MKIIILFMVFAMAHVTVNSSCILPDYRPITLLRNESEAILPGRILSYQNGQLPVISNNYKNTETRDIPIDCGINGAYRHISQRSSCPWKFVINIDDNRIPREIFEAKCRTRHCASSVIDGCSSQRCEEVKHFALVKRRVDESNYKNVLEPITVGCTCACRRWRDFRSRSGRITMCQ